MRRSGKTSSRPSSSHSERTRVYLSLVSTKDTFLDTLLLNRATGVPLYATITEAEYTTIYAIDRHMELHRVATVNWGPGGKSSRTTVTNRANETVPLSEIAATNQAGLDNILEKMNTTDINYSYGQFVSQWTQERPEYEPWFDMVNHIKIVCHRTQPLADPLELPEKSALTSPPPSGSDGPFATMSLCDMPGNPRIKIDLHSRDSLQRITHEDGFTHIDHVVLGALLTCTHGGRKRGREPVGWLNEAQLQEHLRAKRQLNRTRSTETLPLYRARPSTETLPPAYASRSSLQSRQSTR
ncbi:unnamed protein product [Rhizoctonia solani]|uniref:Uncharacterized protein n=1 Tax=Rhizoctonia solani TaxID=456999 RepID=A0A8H3CFH8_9AGAM|nr:unnamed protein product [Rhizoctonia solani]CAE6483657.1 unnamed protein product [Rhizoctonia solani]